MIEKFHVIIPARYESSRFPGKPLVKINGKAIIQYTYEAAIQSGAASVTIATDDERIKKEALGFGAQVVMTKKDHESGTDRVAEAAVLLGLQNNDIIINLQGDEPLMPPKAIYQLAVDLCEHDNVQTATLCEPISTVEELMDPNVVKVVMTKRGYAMYFSRSPIPYDRDNKLEPGIFLDKNLPYYRHRGIYAYRLQFLLDYLNQAKPQIERMEKLEQLRILYAGNKIHVGISKVKIPSDINTPEDLEKLEKLLKQK